MDWEPACAFELISIVSSIRDYRICWLLNQELGYRLEWKEEVPLTTEKGRQRALFTRFAFEDELNKLKYHFINNKYLGENLVPEQKQVDYFLLIEGSHAQIEQQRALQILRESPLVQTAFTLDANSLRSKKNLIFE